MLRRVPLIFKTILLITLLAACSIPRGAALQSEIISKSKAPNSELAVYPVTKTFLPIVANWPATDISGSIGWVRHVHNGHTPIIAVADKITLVIWDNEENSLLTAPQQKVIPIENVTVSPDGSIFVPYLNRIKITGMSDEAARQKIQKKLEKIIPSAQVQLTSIPGLHRSVSLIGGAASPGNYQITDPHYTVLNLISQGGGAVLALANPKGILVLREYPDKAVRQNTSGPSNTRSVFVLDLTSSDGLFSAGQFAINPNDTMLVTESPITAVNTIFSVIGSVVGISN